MSAAIPTPTSATVPWTFAAAPSAAEETDALNEKTLVSESLNGDQRAFGELIRRHQKRVFKLAGRFYRKAEDVEDAAQETFLIAWNKLHTYRAEAPFEHWLTRVCLNCCYGRLRKLRPEVELIDTDLLAPTPDANARLEVERLLSQLPPKDRFVLLLLDGEGWSTTEIAERLGWSRSNVKVRAHRARKKLRKILEGGAIGSTPAAPHDQQERPSR